MNEPAAFSGSYCDLKFVKSRSVCQVIVELPIERAADFVAAFGAPLPGAEIPVALARINPVKAAPEPHKPSAEPPATKGARKYADMPMSTQSALRCQDIAFRRFLAERESAPGIAIFDLDMAVQTVRDLCGVASRSQISEADASGRKWRELDQAYLEWKHAVSYEEIAR